MATNPPAIVTIEPLVSQPTLTSASLRRPWTISVSIGDVVGYNRLQIDVFVDCLRVDWEEERIDLMQLSFINITKFVGVEK